MQQQFVTAFSCFLPLEGFAKAELAEAQIPEPIPQDILLVAMETEKMDRREVDGNLFLS